MAGLQDARLSTGEAASTRKCRSRECRVTGPPIADDGVQLPIDPGLTSLQGSQRHMLADLWRTNWDGVLHLQQLVAQPIPLLVCDVAHTPPHHAKCLPWLHEHCDMYILASAVASLPNQVPQRPETSRCQARVHQHDSDLNRRNLTSSNQRSTFLQDPDL
jgi:hypothetical protein